MRIFVRTLDNPYRRVVIRHPLDSVGQATIPDSAIYRHSAAFFHEVLGGSRGWKVEPEKQFLDCCIEAASRLSWPCRDGQMEILVHGGMA